MDNFPRYRPNATCHKRRSHSQTVTELQLPLMPSADNTIVLRPLNTTSMEKDIKLTVLTKLTLLSKETSPLVFRLPLRMAKNTQLPWNLQTSFSKTHMLTNLRTTRMVRKEPLLRCSDGHTKILRRNVTSSQRLDIWESKYSHQMSLYLLTNGHKMENLTHGSLCISQFPTKWMEEWETESNSNL